jgi:hypothetical protein
MGMRKKWSRRIVVNGITYRWRVAPGAGLSLRICIQQEDSQGQCLLVNIRHPVTDAPGNCSLETIPHAVTPDVIRRLIAGGLDRGWQPTQRGLPGMILRGLDVVPELPGPVPINSTWLTSNVVALARAIRDEGAFDRLPMLGDALEDAGCNNVDILNHCRECRDQVNGSWLVTLLLSKSGTLNKIFIQG